MEDEKIPYGAAPPEPEYAEPEVQDTAPVTEEAPAATEEPPKVDYEKRYQELQKKFGEHSNVVGEVKKQNQSLMQEMAALKAQAQAREEKARNAPPPTDYEKMLSDIAKRADNGDMSLEEALLASNKITREWTKAEAEAEKAQLLEQARSEVQGILASKDEDAVVKDFHAKNPEFATFQQEGRLDQLKAEDPLLDDLSAFWKAQALTAKEQAAAEFERGKQEALRVASGSKPAGKVLADPGTSMQNQQKPTRPLGEAELKASMLAKI